MPTSDRHHVRRVFMEVADLPHTERAAALTRICGGDTTLRQEVEALLRAEAQAGGFMASPTVGAPSDLDAPTMDRASSFVTAPLVPREFEGKSIGPYKLLQLIGEGGFGSVFMAEQTAPVQRKVALKIIKLGMDTRQVVARFEQERQALAMMDHPNIARVLDAGATETGRPFFVMELVKGDPIVEYADKNNLSIQDRLELFAQVCNAVQHAHTKGIIHRDIKPSNILVSTQDGRPHTKVIDFGIAKATASKLTEKTLFTEHRHLIGTPEYMSPEQAEGSMDIDTRTDVYSLGVLLYELLTGVTPFSSKELRSAAYAEIQRIIREVEPPKPSTRISANTDTIAKVASQRHTEPKRLGIIIRGELDWIVMKALEKDRQRRYETANGLGMDIRRYLAGEAVLAAPPSNAYRFKKMIRRNKGPVAAGSAVAVVLVLGLVGTSVGLFRAERARAGEAEQRKQAETARAEAVVQETKAKEQEAEAKKQATVAKVQEAEAKKQAEIAEAVAKFQTDMLAAVDPANLPKDPATGEPLKDSVTVVQAIEAAIKKLDADGEGEGSLKDQPLVEASVRATIGSTLQALGRYAEAEPNLRKSLAIRRTAFPTGHPDIAKGLNNLAVILKDQNKPAEAEPLFREALAVARAAFPGGHPAIANHLNWLATLLQEQNKLAEAEPLQREALAIFRATRPAGHPDIAQGLHNLAWLLQEQNKLAEAVPLQREALAIRRSAFPAGHPTIALGLNNLAALLLAQNKLAEAEPLFREALEIRRAAFPAGHPTIATSLDNLAKLLQAQNKLAEAEPLQREALAIRRSAFPAGHPTIALGLNNLAKLLQAQNKLAEAEPLQREALANARAALPAGHPDIATCLNNLAFVLQAQNKLAEAEPLYREAIGSYRASHPAGHPNFATVLSNLAALLQAQNKLADAEPLYREAIGSYRASHPAGHPNFATALSNLAALLQAQNKLAEAEPLLRESLEIDRKALPSGHPGLATDLSYLAALYWRQGKLDQSIPMFEEALKLGEAALGRQHSGTLMTVANLGVNYKDAGRLAEAIPLLEEAYRASKQYPQLAFAGPPLLDAYAKAADPAKPESTVRVATLMQEMLAAQRVSLPKDSPELAGQLAVFSQTLLTLKAWDEAEPLIREALTIREKAQPDDWRTFNTKSMLGGALLGQNKLAEAEPLLLAGYQGLKDREAAIPPQGMVRIPEALERLVKLYEAKGNEPEAAAWRGKLEAAKAEQTKPAAEGGK